MPLLTERERAATHRLRDLPLRPHLVRREACGVQVVVDAGDRASVDAVLADPRLALLAALRTGRLLDVPDPRLDVLTRAPFRDVWIRVVDPA